MARLGLNSQMVAEMIDVHIYQSVRDFEGSISAEHCIGQLKSQFLSMVKSDLEMSLFRSIKRTFDPNNTLNPGKLLTMKAIESI